MNKTSYNRSDIAKRTSFKLNMSNEESKILIDCFFDVLHDMITETRDRIHIEVRNFGIFDIYPTKARKNARNPKTKEQVTIPARKKIVFKPSQRMKNELYRTE